MKVKAAHLLQPPEHGGPGRRPQVADLELPGVLFRSLAGELQLAAGATGALAETSPCWARSFRSARRK